MTKTKTKTIGLTRDKSYSNQFVDVWGYIPRIRVAIELGYNIILRGPTGTGKTLLIQELAKEYGATLLVMNMTAGASVEEVKGRYVVQPDDDGKTVVQWIDGQLVTAMKKGWWIVIEEANFMPEELASVFYSVMDDRRNLIVDEHENEMIKAHPNFRLFMTANWGYKGTVIPNDAVRNRLDFYADLNYLPEKEEARLIVRKTDIKPKVAELISKFAWSQRRIKSRHQPDISTRILERWAKLIKGGLTPLEAGEHTIVSLLYHNEKEKAKVREALKFEFEELELEAMEEEGKSSKPKSSEPIRKGDLVKCQRLTHTGKRETMYGVVTRISSSRTGEKVWALWNSDKEKAKNKEPGAIPVESQEKMTDCSLVMTKEELEEEK